MRAKSLTATKVAGKNIADISAKILIELVSRAEYTARRATSLFSCAPCLEMSCIAEFILRANMCSI